MVRRETSVKTAASISQSVGQWAKYQNLAGETDNAEASPVRGSYDWRGYLHEETQYARRREDDRKPRKPSVAAAPAPAPSQFYA